MRWQISSRILPTQTIPWIDGAKLVVRNGMTGATGNIYCGLHEFEDMAFVMHVLGADDLFLDVGANIGSYTILAAAVSGARVVSFEPDPEAAAALRRNIAANNLGDRVLTHQAAVGDRADRIFFTVGEDTTNRVVAEGEGAQRSVPQVALDDICEAQGATAIKLDVEGYESNVLAGAEATLSDQRLIAILSECHDAPVASVLNRHGFERAYYAPFTRTLTVRPSAEAQGNLYVRDWLAARARVAAAPRRSILGRMI